MTTQEEKTSAVHISDTVFGPTTETVADQNESLKDQEPFKWDYHVISNLLALCSVVFLGSWVNGVSTSAIAFIAQRFPEEASNAAWIATAPFICGAVITSFIGELSDILGRKKFLLCGCASLFAGALVSGRAGTLAQVIGGQVITGFGVGICFLSNPLLVEIVPKLQRPYATATSTFVSSFAYLGSPVLEGVFIQRKLGGELEGWRVGFYMGAGFAAISGLLILIFYHPMPRPVSGGRTTIQLLTGIDFFGIFLATAGLTLFLVGINYGGNPFPWTSGIVLGPMISGICLIGAFVAWLWKGTTHGVIPRHLFEDKNFTITLIVRVVGGFALLGCQAFLPQMVVYVFGKGGLMTAVWSLPFNITTVLGAFFAALLLRTIKEIRLIIIAALSMLVLGAGLMIAAKPETSFAIWFFASFFMGLAIGTEASSLTVIASLTVPDNFIATGVCIGVSANYLGGSIATTMYSQIFQAKVRELVPLAISNAVVANGLPETSLEDFLLAFAAGNTQAMGLIPGATPTVLGAATTASRAAYSEVFNYIWYTLIAWSAVSVFVSLFYGSTKKYMTMDVSAPVQKTSKKEQNKVAIAS